MFQQHWLVLQIPWNISKITKVNSTIPATCPSYPPYHLDLPGKWGSPKLFSCSWWSPQRIIHMVVSKTFGVPPNHFSRIFPSQASIWGYPHSRKPLQKTNLDRQPILWTSLIPRKIGCRTRLSISPSCPTTVPGCSALAEISLVAKDHGSCKMVPARS